MSAPSPSEAAGGLSRAQRRQLVLITAAAAAIFVGFRLLPTGTNLSHMDFRVDPRAGNAIEFCDPLNPQFIPVVAARSPVALEVRTAEPARAGERVEGVAILRTAGGKPVGPADLLVTHTRRLHLLIVDPARADYQHVHPEPGRTPGEWTFAFTPRGGGVYRIFGDFTPAATARGLYAAADLPVAGGALAPVAAAGEAAREGRRYRLAAGEAPRAGRPIEFRFSATQAEGGPVRLEPVMDALAHLVAFDAGRTGFAHLHPVDPVPSAPAGGVPSSLSFKLTVPEPGAYVIWAQVKVEGREEFVPFSCEVGPR